MVDEFDFSIMRPDELRNAIVMLQTLTVRATSALKAAKNEWARNHDSGDMEDITVGGENAGNITLTRGSEGGYKVVDPVAYANVLCDIEAYLSGGRKAWEKVNYPRSEAMREKFIDQLVRDHGGEVPDGVEYKPGRPQTVTLRLARGVTDKAFTVQQLDNTMRLIGGSDVQ